MGCKVKQLFWLKQTNLLKSGILMLIFYALLTKRLCVSDYFVSLHHYSLMNQSF